MAEKLIQLPEDKPKNPFSGWPMVFAFIAMGIFAIHACTRMVGAGDTWVAMSCGRHFVEHGVDTNEPFSANSHRAGPTKESMGKFAKQLRADSVDVEGNDLGGVKYGLMRWWAGKCENYENWGDGSKKFVKWFHPTGWVNQNWLTHVIFYKLVPGSSHEPLDEFRSNALVYWKFVVYITLIICVYHMAKLIGVTPLLAAAFACFALFTGRSYFDVRPAGFSNLMVGVYLLVLVLTTYKSYKFIWLIVPMTIFWCNAHGGYLYLFIMLVPFVGINILTRLPRHWSISLSSIGLCAVLYKVSSGLFSGKVIGDINALVLDLNKNASTLKFRPLAEIVPSFPFSSALLMLLVFVVGSILIASFLSKSKSLLYIYHIAGIFIISFVLLLNFAVKLPLGISKFLKPGYSGYLTGELHSEIGGSLVLFIIAFLFVTLISLMVCFRKDRILVLSVRGIVHTILAGVVSFFAMLIFNPFHLTNLTHTFVISLSKHAESWRNVNEWHPGVEWDNPVGTSYPFFVLLLLFFGGLAFWSYSYYIKPRVVSNKKGDVLVESVGAESKLKMFGYCLAGFLGFVTLISFSFTYYDPTSIICLILFMAIIFASIYWKPYAVYLFVPFILLALYVPTKLAYSIDVGSRWFFGDFSTYANSEWNGDGLMLFSGRYIYLFMLVPFYFVMSAVCGALGKKVKFGFENMTHVVISALLAIVVVSALFIWAGDPFDFEVPKVNELTGKVEIDPVTKRAVMIVPKATPLERVFRGKAFYKPAYVNNADPSYSFHKYNYVNEANSLYVNRNAICFLVAFNVLFALLGIFWVWIKGAFRDSVGVDMKESVEQAEDEQVICYKEPMIDLSLIAIAALTIYMAIKMRRFIPSAAIAACPVIALFVEQTTKNISISMSFNKLKRYVRPVIPRELKKLIIIAVIFATTFLGTYWGLKFKRIYLDAWYNDQDYTTMFMRMTASDVKPFKAMKFIDDNNLSGNMFNYWTEGGFIAWGQTPDAETGKTALRLFMDGRAQAAYEHSNFILWNKIMSCGKTEGITDVAAQRKWLNAKLRKYKAWIVLMPYNEFNEPLVTCLRNDPEWEQVYISHKQVIYVDMTTEKGQNLVQGIKDGTVVYPDEYLKNNILSYYLYNEADVEDVQFKAEIKEAQMKIESEVFKKAEIEGLKKAEIESLIRAEIEGLKNTENVKVKEAAIFAKREKALALALSSFKEYTSLSSLNLVSRSLTFTGVFSKGAYSKMRQGLYAFMDQYIQDFQTNSKTYSKQDGYLHRINSVSVMAERLVYTMTSEEDRQDYIQFIKDLQKEMIIKRDSKRW